MRDPVKHSTLHTVPTHDGPVRQVVVPEWAKKTLMYLTVAAVFIIAIMPFYIMIINATRTNAQINRGLSLIPGTAVVRNFISLTGRVNIFRGLANSLFVSSSAVFLTSYFSSMTAFGFAFYKFPGRNVLFAVVLGMMMVPPQLGLIGLYDLANNLGLLDTFWILILPPIANPFIVFFLRQYSLSIISKDLLDAAKIDGARDLQVFHRIAIPLLTPGIATMAIFAFVQIWNNYVLPLVLIFSRDRYVLPLIIASLNTSTHRTDFGALYLAVAISVVPILIAFVFFQRYLISGVAFGGLRE